MKLKKNNKKGFTIVELVIVIAVIAILAAVLIPTFSGLVEKANASAAYQAMKNEYTQYIAENAENMTGTEEYQLVYIKGNNKYIANVKAGQIDASATKGDKTVNSTEDLSKYDVYTLITDEKNFTAETAYKKNANGEYVRTVGNDTWNAGTYYTKTSADLGSDEVAIYDAK